MVALSLLTTPYNADSMQYHLPRIMHWLQNGSVAHYATTDLRQVANPVLPEFILMHLYLLTGQRDFLLNLLQTVSLFTCILMIYRITRRLVPQRRLAVLASALYFTVPVVFAESLSTQTDVFSTVWLLFYLYILLDFAGPQAKLVFDGPTRERVFLLGLLVGIGYLAKPVVCIAMLLLLGWIFIMCIARKDSLWTVLRLALCAAPCVVLPLVPQTVRMLRTFGQLTAPIMSASLLVATLEPRHLLVNCAMNLAANMSTPLIYHSWEILAKCVEVFSKILHVDIYDLVTTVYADSYYILDDMYWQDNATNPVIVYTALLLLLIAAVYWWRHGRPTLIYSYALAAIISFFAICAVLRWSATGTRYEVAYFALLCPAIACILQKIFTRPWGQGIIAVLVFMCSTQFMSLALYHTWNAHLAAGRPKGYFYSVGDTIFEEQAEICRYIEQRNFKNIGLHIGPSSLSGYEYPLWCMLRDANVRLEHVLVDNETAVYTDTTFMPDCIYWDDEPPEETITIRGTQFTLDQKIGENCYLFIQQ